MKHTISWFHIKYSCISGTFCVMLSFPFLFMKCLANPDSDNWAKFIYYAPLVVIFQIGWAATQISHLSLIPELTPNNNERVELNAIRYIFLLVMIISADWRTIEPPPPQPPSPEIKGVHCNVDIKLFLTKVKEPIHISPKIKIVGSILCLPSPFNWG